MLIPPVSDLDHVQGFATADITLVEYGDYHNQQCAAALPWIEALQARLGNRLRLIFRHFPASRFHPHAAEAAEAAGLQGRFWEMHAVLFAHPSALGSGHLVEYARDLGLDTVRFLRDMAGQAPTERVLSDLASGAESGVSSTPAFFINGVCVNGVCGLSAWKVGLASLAAASGQNIAEIDRWADDGAPPALDGGDEGIGEGNHAP